MTAIKVGLEKPRVYESEGYVTEAYIAQTSGKKAAEKPQEAVAEPKEAEAKAEAVVSAEVKETPDEAVAADKPKGRGGKQKEAKR